ncbi:methyltransferase domain-containing protein [Litoribaculum gwangyangense]|uniref:Methyltransferase domain-containing protein n=1 Tax=Litoribaculum gwangyangense TaxID=1130722 RepID=A0ABP9CIZ4_9FLAO
MDLELNEAFWDSRYQNNDIGWDLGEISKPIKSYINQLHDKNLKILIPGCGNSYEAEFLYKQGFKNTYVVDLSKTALDNLKKRVPSFPSSNLLHKDFFEIQMTFDLIIEQTFFCAINPNLRPKYVQKMHELLNNNGKLVGLLFNTPLNTEHPPFGGNKEEYLQYFKPYFDIEIMNEAYNSMETRRYKELFIKLVKR